MIAKFDDVVPALRKEFKSEYGSDANFEHVLKLSDFLFRTFVLTSRSNPKDTSEKNLGDRIAASQIFEITKSIFEASKGTLPLQIKGETILDKRDVYNSPLRLVPSYPSMSLIYFSNRNGGKYDAVFPQWRDEIEKIAKGL